VLLWLGEPQDAPKHPNLLRVHPRSDIPGRGIASEGSLPVSSATGAGLGKLTQAIVDLARSVLPAEGEIALNERQAECLQNALHAIEGARGGDLVIIAESLRQTRSAFDRLTGRAGVEDLLDALFGRFCLGK
jgi:tRNA modification GTPase